NLSARQFSDDQLMKRIETVLEETGFPAKQLELEVTESMVIDNIDSAIQTMRHIREMGIEIAIDDFGTGQSSLSYLHRFPINSLKIDRAFIRDLSGEQEDSPIADMVIALGRALKLRVVAEGVETTEQLSYLCQAGCDELQGYLISRPLPIDRLATFVVDHERKSA
ncbi:MAG: EAL domain-containing protein (putative c-di-GMP-specific phosphodiesterase class I), partial [Myxococcota bacterium]